jgi:hypothetical protein
VGQPDRLLVGRSARHREGAARVVHPAPRDRIGVRIHGEERILGDRHVEGAVAGNAFRAKRAKRVVPRDPGEVRRVVAQDELVRGALRDALVPGERTQARDRCDPLLEEQGPRGPPLLLLGQASQLLAQHGGLPLGDARIRSQHPLREPVVARLLAAAVHQGLEALFVGGVAGGDDPPFPGGHQLAALHREGAEVPDRARSPTSPAGSVSVSAILDQEKPGALRQLPEAVEIRHRAGQVDRQDRLGARTDRRRDLVRIQAVGLREHVHEDGDAAGCHDRARGPDEGVGGGDDLGAGRDAGRLERQGERDGAVQGRHRIARSDIGGELPAESPRLQVGRGMASPVPRFEHALEGLSLRCAELGPARPGARSHRAPAVNRELFRQRRASRRHASPERRNPPGIRDGLASTCTSAAGLLS